MARQLRLEQAGGLYHVTSRGDRRDNIYEDDEDRNKWLEILGHTCKRYKWRCHAYCLMDNHYHFVIETAEANLSKGMRQLNGVYTQYYNRRHQRAGHVFQGRYKGILVEQVTYLLELSRYVVLNPLRARLIKNVEKYKWSSYRATTGIVEAQPWLDVKWILSQFSKQRKRAREKYINFVREGVGLPSIWGELQNQIFLGSEKFINKHQKKIKAKETLNDIPKLQKRKLPKALKYYADKYKDQNKSILNAYLSGGYTLKEIGEYFGMHYSTVSRIVKANE